jgi:hypothetical protein
LKEGSNSWWNKDIEKKQYLLKMKTMINVKKFIFDKLRNEQALSSYVWTRIYPQVAPLGSQWPLIVYNRITPGKLDLKGIRNEYFQISIWSKSSLENEQIVGVITWLFNWLKEKPVKHVDIQWVDESYDADTETYWNHVSIHIKLLDV